MSDPNGSGKNPSGPEAEFLGPERTQHAGPRERKEPPVIEGEAEEVGASGAASGPRPADDEMPSSASAPRSAISAGLVAGLAGAIIVALIFYAFGLARQDGAGERAVADLDTRVASLEQAGSTEAASLKSEIDRLAARLGAAEEKIDAGGQNPDSAPAMARLDKLEAEAGALKQSLSEVHAASEASRQKLDQLSASLPPRDIADQVARLDALVKALNTALDALAPRIDQMATRVAALETKKDEPGAAARAALGLALANLARAAESAQPFKTELDTVAQFLPDEPELAGLQPAAARGVPTQASLKERFPAFVQAVLDADRRARDDGLWSRFVASARKLVTVRRTGEVSGTTSEAVLARMEERLKVDDLPAALAEAEALQGPAAAAGAAWLGDARARVATTRLLRDLSAHVAARLAPPPSGAKG